MDKQPKLSIVVPVFRTEKYLSQCIDSVLQQSYNNFELILVDDGSDDKSPFICDGYAKKDPRVIVLYQKNSGLSAARNAGIRIASGDYILFLDSDDYWDDLNALSKLVPDLTCDVVNYGFKKYFDSSGQTANRWVSPQIKETYDALPSVEEKILFLTKHSCYLSCAWNKAVRRSLFQNNALNFREGVLSEDIDWSARVLLTAESMALSPCDFYCYRQREYSITKSIGLRHLQDLKSNIELCRTFITDNISPERKLSYCIYLAYQAGTFFASSSLVHDSSAKALVLSSESLCELLKYRYNTKIKALYWIYRIFGIRGLYLFSKIYALKRG